MMSSSRLAVEKIWVRNALRSFHCYGEATCYRSNQMVTTTAMATRYGSRQGLGFTARFEWGLHQQQQQLPLLHRPSWAIRFSSDKASNENEAKAQDTDEPTTKENGGTTSSETTEPSATDDGKSSESAQVADDETTTSSSSTDEPEPPSREEELELEVKGLRDHLLRSLAEQENTRRIAKRDVEEARNFAIKSFAKSLLDVSDNLSRALEAVPEDFRADKEGNPVLATLYEGIQLTDQELIKAFEKNGLKKYGKEGDVFDPNIHEALYEYLDPKKTPGTVGQVMKPGFTLNKRVLRPAEVGVIKKP